MPAKKQKPKECDDWTLRPLACASCNHHWTGVYSSEYKRLYPLGDLIQCPRCHSRLGPHPKSKKTCASCTIH